MPAVLPIAEAAHALGAVPLLWLVVARPRDAIVWWLGAALGVSFAADSAAHWVAIDAIGAVYPLLQAALVGMALLSLRQATILAAVLGWAVFASIQWFGPEGFDLAFRALAWGAIVWLALRLRGLLRWSLLVTFGIGYVGWLLYAAWPSLGSWGLYQMTRVVGVGLFCWAVSKRGNYATV